VRDAKGKRTQPDIAFWTHTGTVLIDVSVCCAFAKSNIINKHPIRTRERQKTGKYTSAAAARGAEFIPFVVDSLGRFGEGALRVIDLIVTHHHRTATNPHDNLQDSIIRCIGAVLQRGNGWSTRPHSRTILIIHLHLVIHSCLSLPHHRSHTRHSPLHLAHLMTFPASFTCAVMPASAAAAAAAVAVSQRRRSTSSSPTRSALVHLPLHQHHLLPLLLRPHRPHRPHPPLLAFVPVNLKPAHARTRQTIILWIR
jgi:hypothetical protein